MKMYTLVAIILTLAGVTSQLNAENYKSSDGDIEKHHRSVVELSKSANLAAQRAGVAEVGAISCDSAFIHCSCKGAINCAWLALACGEAGGIQGFEGDCFFPDSVPGARAAVNNFVSLNATEEANCKGIFCSCSGPSDSDDCKKIKACADDISCVGDDCGCIGGHVD